MTTLTDFLLARIAEDERIGRILQRSSLGEDRQIRLLADCEAKRRIVQWCGPRSHDAPGTAASTTTARFVLASLALPYADHPDFQEEWRA